MNLSIIIPTVGRPSLIKTLQSIKIDENDEIIVVADGDCELDLGPKVKCYSVPKSNDWGATPRAFGVKKATGKMLLFIDDDDIYLPNALETVHKIVDENPNRPIMFRMQNGPDHHRNYQGPSILWLTPEVKHGNVSTQMICFPNVPDRLGSWTGSERPGGKAADWHFISTTFPLWPEGSFLWREEIICYRNAAVV